MLHERHGVDYREMAVITPYSAQKNLIRELKAKKQAKATGSATSGACRDPADTKLEELAIVSITESQGEVSLNCDQVCGDIKLMSFPILSCR